jgi:hypothetical protein
MSDFDADCDIISYFSGYAEALNAQESLPVKRESRITSFFSVSKTTSDCRRWAGKPRKPRPPREPRRVHQGEWDSELSESENVERLRRNRLVNMRRRAKRLDAQLSEGRRGDQGLCADRPSGVVGRPHGGRRNRVLLSPSSDADGNRGGPPGFSAVDKSKRVLGVRRQGRDVTPEWLEVPDSDRHKYAKLAQPSASFGYLALKEWTLRSFESEMSDEELCGVCPGQHVVADCPRLSGFAGKPEKKRKRDDVVDMGELFSFMDKKPKLR